MAVYLAGKILQTGVNVGLKLVKPTSKTIYADLYAAAEGGNLKSYAKTICKEFPDIIPLVKAKLADCPSLHRLNKVGSIFSAVRAAHPLR